MRIRCWRCGEETFVFIVSRAGSYHHGAICSRCNNRMTVKDLQFPEGHSAEKPDFAEALLAALPAKKR